MYVSSGKSSVITYIKKHGQIQKDNNSEKISHILCFMGLFLPRNIRFLLSLVIYDLK